MRNKKLILIIAFAATVKAYTQEDFFTLDKQNYEAYLKGDYKAFKTSSSKLLSQGSDYYYLRLRNGISDFGRTNYSSAVKHFTKALEFYSDDTISREYIYYSYYNAGRIDDAYYYLSKLQRNNLNYQLRSLKRPTLNSFFTNITLSNHNDIIYDTSPLPNQTTLPTGFYYEAMSKTQSIDVGFNTYLGTNWKGIFSYKNFRKNGKVYTEYYPAGIEPDFVQNQFYGSFTRMFFSGWELSFFGHLSMYSGIVTETLGRGNRVTQKTQSDLIGGVNISKRSWYVRGELGISASNFSYSNQLRGEAKLTIYPLGNLNLYLTTNGMMQKDSKWGNTFLFSQDLGFKVAKFFWFETGVSKGNSFLYAKNRGYFVYNSYSVNNNSAYINLAFYIKKHTNLNLTAFYDNSYSYFWNFNDFTRYNKKTNHSFGGSINLTLNF